MADHRWGWQIIGGDGRSYVWVWQIIGVGMADHRCGDGGL